MLRNITRIANSIKTKNPRTTNIRNFQTTNFRTESSFPIEVHWKLPDGTLKSSWATPGEMMLDVAIDNSIDEDMNGMFGVCGGGMCCSTCHVILDQEVYDNITPPTEDEDDLLDYIPGLTKTSRLACCVRISKNMEEKVIVLPEEVADL